MEERIIEDPLQIISSLYSLIAVVKVKFDCYSPSLRLGLGMKRILDLKISTPFLFSGIYFQNDISKHNSSVAMKN